MRLVDTEVSEGAFREALEAGARRYLVARRRYIDSYGGDDNNCPIELGWRVQLTVRGRRSILWQMLMPVDLVREGSQKTNVYLYATTSLLGSRSEVGVVLMSEHAFGSGGGEDNGNGFVQLIYTQEGEWV